MRLQYIKTQGHPKKVSATQHYCEGWMHVDEIILQDNVNVPEVDTEDIVCIRGGHVKVLGLCTTVLHHHRIYVELGHSTGLEQAPADGQVVLRTRRWPAAH